ncbi:DUF2164 domain-containing protein [Candidatus Gracilibacteria bacterium]|nr:DUF2164 domain-containing protein [Candidatus Gracilibacteria bacterium]
MPNIKRKWDVISKERRESLIREVINYFKTEKDEEIGIIAAEDILDFFLERLHKDIYNKGIEDAKTTIKQTLENLDIDLDLLSSK